MLVLRRECVDCMNDQIKKELLRLQDRKYRDFQVKLLPTADPETVIGVRTPQLRKYAKELKDSEAAARFLRELPHQYFEENHIKIRDVNFDVQIRDERRIYTNVYTIELPKGYSYAEMVEELSLYKNIVRIRLISV